MATVNTNNRDNFRDDVCAKRLNLIEISKPERAHPLLAEKVESLRKRTEVETGEQLSSSLIGEHRRRSRLVTVVAVIVEETWPRG